jgi:hypothetical protein
MTSSLASRLGDIPGVASVVVDLDGFGRGIDVRLEPGADEAVVMEKLRALLAAYGVRRERQPTMSLGRSSRNDPLAHVGVQVNITPIDSGARIEVATSTVKSFRIVAASPLSVAQGLADAWCQVIGRIPVEIVGVSVDEEGRLVVTASDDGRETTGSAKIERGWVEALTGAVAGALDESDLTDLTKAAS